MNTIEASGYWFDERKAAYICSQCGQEITVELVYVAGNAFKLHKDQCLNGTTRDPTFTL